MLGVSNLLGNIAMTTIQSMFELPEEGAREVVEKLLLMARENAFATAASDARRQRDLAEQKKPRLAIVNDQPGANVVPLRKERTSSE